MTACSWTCLGYRTCTPADMRDTSAALRLFADWFAEGPVGPWPT